VEIYGQAIKKNSYTCFLNKDTKLPMMYMDDAIRAAIQLMSSDAGNITIRSSYNLAAMSFSPKEIAQSIQEHIPDFTITYSPDFRQEIADSWPSSINDSKAREDWEWKHKFNLSNTTKEMLSNLQ
jgi:nucleoside-diphosphate-sugar epimerase